MKKIAITLLLTMLWESFFPIIAYALTNGPHQAEFYNFTPAGNTELVNLFTGDFEYSIPLLEVPGPGGSTYPVTLSYKSGLNPEEDASWVGYGWTLNAGAIIRNKRGFADEMRGETVNYYNRNKTVKTVTNQSGIGVELYSGVMSLAYSRRYSYSNYNGFSRVNSYNAALLFGSISANYSTTITGNSFDYRTSPLNLITGAALYAIQKSNLKKGDKKLKAKDALISGTVRTAIGYSVSGASGVLANNESFSTNGSLMPGYVPEYSAELANYSFGTLVTAVPITLGFDASVQGSYATQSASETQSRTAYGYMYVGDINNLTDIVDYGREKDNPFSLRKKFNSISYPNADFFHLTAEGAQGGFRLYNYGAGTMRPETRINEVDINTNGLDLSIGNTFGTGYSRQDGTQRTRSDIYYNSASNLGNYTYKSSAYSSNLQGGKPIFMRFAGDKGANINGYDSEGDAPVGFSLTESAPSSFVANILEMVSDVLNYGQRVEGNRFIHYNTNEDINVKTSGGKAVYRAGQYTWNDTFLNRSESALLKSIGEIYTYNEAGFKYVYGLPTYSKLESNNAYTALNQMTIASDLSHAIGSTSNLQANKRVVWNGMQTDFPYASQYLLTEITSPDYQDTDSIEGPSQYDLGSYTLFDYHREYGTNNKTASALDNWYKWRFPYNAFDLHAPVLSDRENVLGAVSAGYKELYYLREIKTKTHRAKFIFYKDESEKTDIKRRYDGYDANHNEETAGSSVTATGINGPRRLDRIELYSLNQDGSQTLVKTVRFVYDYSLMKNLPGNLSGQYNESGKLTLKAIYTDYNGTINAEISPYEFHYEYPNFTVPSAFSSGLNWSSMFSSVQQNPDYNRSALDAWGVYQADGSWRSSKLKSNLSQKDNAGFDPAAWHLKKIVLPSKGEVHIQYEQKDYAYVQNRDAMALVPVAFDGAMDLFTVKVDSLSSHSTSPSSVMLMRDLIRKNYIDQGNRMFFKILFTLKGTAIPSFDFCNEEYVTGYAKVKDVFIDGTGNLKIRIDDGDQYFSPIQGCRDFVYNQRVLKQITDDLICENVDNQITDGASQLGQIGEFQNILLLGSINNEMSASGQSSHCKEYNPNFSYFRLPLPVAKKGGGVRVKRLFYLQPNADASQAQLYGHTFDYTIDDPVKGKISSGVASNEPMGLHEENPLINVTANGVSPMKAGESLIRKVFLGEDKEQQEGPVGETLLPSAMVGYSSVTVRSIFEGTSSEGFSRTDFFTAKEFPTLLWATDLKITQTKDEYINKVFRLLDEKEYYATQGFSIVLNNMHGVLKSVEYFSGSDPEEEKLVAGVYNEYFKPGEAVPLFNGFGKLMNYRVLGRDVEFSLENNAMLDVLNLKAKEFDLNFSFLGGFPQPSAMFMSNKTSSTLFGVTSTKIIQYTPIQKAVTTFKNGSSMKLENIAFSPLTGKPVITRYTDGYNGLMLGTSVNPHQGVYTAYEQVAASYYDGMSKKSFNERLRYEPLNTGVAATNMSITYQIISGNHYIEFGAVNRGLCDIVGRFSLGDLVLIEPTTSPASRMIMRVTAIDLSTNRIKVERSRYGASYIPDNAAIRVEIVASGRTNDLTPSYYSYLSYGQKFTPDQYALHIDKYQLFLRNRLVMELNKRINSNLSGNLVLSTNRVFEKLALDQNDDNICDVGPLPTINLTISGAFVSFGVIPGSSMSLPLPGAFELNPISGKLSFRSSSSSPACDAISVGVLNFCNPTAVTTAIPFPTDSLIHASVSIFSDNWPFTASTYDYLITNAYNDFDKGKRGRWREKQGFVFNSTISSSNSGGGRVYNGGIIQNFVNYDWQGTNDPRWNEIVNIEKYDPFGYPLQQKDQIQIKSVSKYGYGKSKPYLIAYNALEEELVFEPFEYLIYGKYENNVTPIPSIFTTAEKHTGRRSVVVNHQTGLKYHFTATSSAKNKGVLVRIWVKFKTEPSNFNTNALKIYSRAGGYADLTYKGRSGAWCLFEHTISSAAMTGVSANDTLSVQLENRSGDQVYMDDLRISRTDTRMQAYVYDIISDRVMAEIDDDHFAVVYQYNGEGKLVRTLQETYRGFKTVAEQQVNEPRINRYPSFYGEE